MRIDLQKEKKKDIDEWSGVFCNKESKRRRNVHDIAIRGWFEHEIFQNNIGLWEGSSTTQDKRWWSWSWTKMKIITARIRRAIKGETRIPKFHNKIHNPIHPQNKPITYKNKGVCNR